MTAVCRGFSRIKKTALVILALLCIFPVFFLFNSCSEPEIQIIEPPTPKPMALPDSLSVVNLKFIDSLNGWLSIAFLSKVRKHTGGLFKTTDGGYTWHANFLLDSSLIQQMFFIGKEHGWIAGTKGFIAHTTNAGKAWVQYESNEVFNDNERNAGFGGISFLNLYEGWLSGSIYDGGLDCSGHGFFLRTTNAGNSWETVYTTLERSLTGVAMLPTGNGWVAGAGHYLDCAPYILHSSDYGATWNRQQINPSFSGNTYYTTFFDDNYGYVTGVIGILRTTNGGTTWDTTGRAIGSASDIAIINDSLVYVVGGYGFQRSFGVYKSIDKGENWSKQIDLTGSFRNVFFINEQYGWVAGQTSYPTGFALYRFKNDLWTKIR